MKRWKKILLVLVAVVLLAQIPFCYRRYRIGQLAGKIEALQAERVQTAENSQYNEYKGIIHAHTNIGGHSTGTFEELIKAAQANELDYVLMTEHTTELFDTSALTLNGNYGGALFIGGQEANTATGDRFLLIPGSADSFRDAKLETPQFIEKYKAPEQNRLVLVTYPEKLKSWNADFDGIEIFSLHTNAKRMNPALFAGDALWSYYSYPELLLTKYFTRPDENLRKYDELTQTGKLTLFVGTDAHSNIGFHLVGDDAQNKIINLKFDDYATIFRLARNHVLLEKDKPLTPENLLQALKNGRAFVGFDTLADSRGFTFTAGDKIMGDEITLTNGDKINLKAAAPLAARFVIFRNGEKVYEQASTPEVNFEAREKGAYRVEVYLDSIGFNQMPWIISNPIYLR
ncbi:MAG: hypothetical protein M3384_17560 [Acidobacteriota bacterium]|nr:hypothetical protein [Acidobacteriota bacterium]